MHSSVSDFCSSFINWFNHFHNKRCNTQHKYMFALICNVNIQNAQAAAYIVNWWMDVLEKQSNVLWQKMYGANGLGVWGHLNLQPHDKCSTIWNLNYQDQGWGAVSDLSLISDLSQKFKHDLWRVKSELKLSQKQHLTPDAFSIVFLILTVVKRDIHGIYL